MQVQNVEWSPRKGWTSPRPEMAQAKLVIYFGSRANLGCGSRFDDLRAMFPAAAIVGCSTGGQIVSGDVSDDTVTAIAMTFERTEVGIIEQPISGRVSSFEAGSSIGAKLARADLKSIFVLSDGLLVNGSELVAGIQSTAGRHVLLTGGLAGDGADFQSTLVGANSAPAPGKIGAVAFYGSAVMVGHGSAGGWDEFGPIRKITKSDGNVLFEVDGKPIMDLYEHYLGDEAAGLPGTGLLYPLLIKDPANPEHALVRTILAVDRENRSMTFAGDMPHGWSAQLMRGHFDRLAEGAGDAARQATSLFKDHRSDVAAIMISCIGRRILMGQKIIDEIQAAQGELGERIHAAGFYSYGEISPHHVSGMCELHNQTMTVTTIAEAA